MFDKQFLEIAVWVQKTFFEKVILINILGRTFCEIDLIVQKFEIITLNTIRK